MTITHNGNGNYTVQFTPAERSVLALLVARYGANALESRIQQWLEQGARERQEQVREAWANAPENVKARVLSDLGVS